MSKIRDLRKLRGMALVDVAKAIGVTPAQVSRWETGKSTLSIPRLEQLAGVYGVAAAELVEDGVPIAPPANAEPFEMEGPSAQRMAEDLPVFGTALGAPTIIDGEAVEQTTLNTGDIVHYAKRPVILDGRADAYGLYVQGHSMEPVHLAGDLILAETKRPARIGDDVVVYLRVEGEDDDGLRSRAVLLKRLVRRTAAYIELEQFNPPLKFRLPVDAVIRVDRTLRLADLIA